MPEFSSNRSHYDQRWTYGRDYPCLKGSSLYESSSVCTPVSSVNENWNL